MPPFTIRQLKSVFADELSPLYATEECGQFVSMLLEHHCGLSRTAQLMAMDNLLAVDKQELILLAMAQLKTGIPIQYIVGEAWFMDHLFEVNASVLIPRPETEELVDKVVTYNAKPDAAILDIGTGSGCIAISLKLALPDADVSAWDVSPEALAVARRNAVRNNCAVAFEHVDVLAVKPHDISRRFDIIVSNPPYVCDSEKDEMHVNVLNNEPHLALFVPNDDALKFYRAIGELGLQMLNTGGLLFFEINQAFGSEMVLLLESLGYSEVELFADLQGKDRIVKAVMHH